MGSFPRGNVRQESNCRRRDPQVALPSAESEGNEWHRSEAARTLAAKRRHGVVDSVIAKVEQVSDSLLRHSDCNAQSGASH